jgi:hypothetical protein
VQTAGLVLADGDGFRVWINRPEKGLSLQLGASQASGIREMTPVPFTAAAGVVCEREFVLTGADAAGRPVVAGISADGSIAWHRALPSADPVRWPFPGCGTRPLVVWQDTPRLVHACEILPSGLVPREPFPVGGPPLAIAVADDSIWCIWSGGDGVIVAESSAAGLRQIPLGSTYSSAVAIGECGSAVCAAWIGGETALLATLMPGSSVVRKREQLDLGNALGGSLGFVSAPFPLIVFRTSQTIEGEPVQLRSVLTSPGMAPVEVAGLLHSAAYNSNVVALLGSSGLYFLAAGG